MIALIIVVVAVITLIESLFLKVSIWFTNFYQSFIQRKMIATSLILKLKTSKNNKPKTRLGKDRLRVDYNNKN